MKTIILVTSMKELKIVADYFGIEVKSSEIAVAFPYRFEIERQIYTLENDEITFEEFIERYN